MKYGEYIKKKAYWKKKEALRLAQKEAAALIKLGIKKGIFRPRKEEDDGKEE